MRITIRRNVLDDVIWCAPSRCAGCGRDVHALREFFMVDDGVWHSVMPSSRGFLCVGCCEVLLGRDLGPADFTDCPLNIWNRCTGSLRLRRRLFGGEDPPDPDEPEEEP